MANKTPSSPVVAVAALGAEISSGPPVDFRILPAGEFRSWDGRPVECSAWVMTAEDGKRIADAINARASSVVIDWEHATLIAKKTGAQAPASGWYRHAEWRDDGLWLIGIEWTALAAQQITDLHYRFLSPVFSYDPKSGRVLSLLHASLTNDPGIDGLTDLAAMAAELFFSPTQSKESQMTLLEKLLAALGLQGGATDVEALAAVESLKGNVAALSAQISQPDPARFVPVAVLSALQGEHAELQGKLAALSAEVAGSKLEQVIADGLAAGKLVPATEGWARDLGKSNLAALTAFMESAPVVVAPGQTQSGGVAPASQTASLSATASAVSAAFGLTDEQYRQAEQA